MKRMMTTLILLISGLIVLGQTYTVNLTGGVFDEDTEDPIVQAPVWIFSDSTDGFEYYNTLYTDGNGEFQDSFDVPTDLTGTLYVSVGNCDGTYLTEVLPFSENSTEIEAVFFVCSDPAGEDCEAMFYYYPEANDWLTIQFTDASYGFPNSWSWDFGDGNMSTEQNPVHTFGDFGEYLITLTISDDSADCTSSIEMPIYVGDSIWFPDTCMAWFFACPDSSDFMTLHFQDMSFVENGNPPTSWLWVFGDNNTSTEQNPVHTYAEEGSYEVCLTISNDDGSCTSTYCEYVEVMDWDSYCQAQFYYFPLIDSMPNGGDLSIQFMDYSYGNPTEWSWSFGDGTGSDEQNPIHTYGAEGFYDVCLTIANPADSCESTYCQEVYVYNDSTWDCYGWFEYEIDDLSVDFSGYIDNSQTGDYFWEFGDGTTAEGQQVSHTYAENGLYVVTMTAIDSLNMCFVTYTDAIWVGDFTFDVFGNVYLEDSVLADYATVYLMTFDTIEEDLVAVYETEIDENGHYLFEEVSGENFIYFVQAELTEMSAYFGDYVPTYSYSALNWEDASPVFPSPSGWWYDIEMIPAQTLYAGNGLISGVVNNDDGRSTMENVEMLLLDESGNPLTYNKTDESGDFDFEDLAYGTYIVYTEMVGIHTTPVTVVLSEDSPEVFLSIVVANGEAVLGIGDAVSAYVGEVSDVFPNPVNGEANIEILTKQDAQIDIAVTNSLGNVIYQEEQKYSPGNHRFSIDTQSLPKGMYFVSVRSSDGITVVKKLVKL